MTKNIIIAILALVSILSLSFGYTQKVRADKNLELAQQNAARAEEQARIALQNQQMAQEQMMIAQHEAEAARAEADRLLASRKK